MLPPRARTFTKSTPWSFFSSSSSPVTDLCLLEEFAIPNHSLLIPTLFSRPITQFIYNCWLITKNYGLWERPQNGSLMFLWFSIELLLVCVFLSFFFLRACALQMSVNIKHVEVGSDVREVNFGLIVYLSRSIKFQIIIKEFHCSRMSPVGQPSNWLMGGWNNDSLTSLVWIWVDCAFKRVIYFLLFWQSLSVLKWNSCEVLKKIKKKKLGRPISLPLPYWQE